MDVDLRLTNTDKVNWFFRSPVYKHFSLLTEYRGGFTETASGRRTEVEGLCAFEYGACPSLYQLRSKPLPPGLKAPLTISSTRSSIWIPTPPSAAEPLLPRGRPFMTTALQRSRTDFGRRFRHAEFRVEEYRPTPEDTPTASRCAFRPPPDSGRWMPTVSPSTYGQNWTPVSPSASWQWLRHRIPAPVDVGGDAHLRAGATWSTSTGAPQLEAARILIAK